MLLSKENLISPVVDTSMECSYCEIWPKKSQSKKSTTKFHPHRKGTLNSHPSQIRRPINTAYRSAL